jgi:uncharacterized protein YggE
MSGRLLIGVPTAAWVAIGALVLLGGHATGAATGAAQPLEQATPVPHTISVSGEGEARGAPNVAYVSVGVVIQAPTAAEATGQNSRLMTAVLDALRARGVGSSDLQTSGLSVSPQYAHDGREVVGYQATNNVTVTVNQVDRAGELLDVALGAGANRIWGLRFGLRNPAALRQEALAEAVQSARHKAEALAAELGVRVVGVSSVTEEVISAAVPRAGPVAMAQAEAAPPPVEPGELRVTTRVRVAFLFE